MACNTNQKFPDFKSDVRNLIRSTYRKLVFDLDEDLEENVETELCRVVEEYFKIDLIKEYNKDESCIKIKSLFVYEVIRLANSIFALLFFIFLS